MVIRFEVAERKTFYWKYFLQRARLHGRNRSKKDGVYRVTVLGLDSALELWQVTRSWKAVWYYVNEQPIGAERFADIMRKHQFRDLRARQMLDQVLVRAQRRRDREDADKRWRSGQGPDPSVGF